MNLDKNLALLKIQSASQNFKYVTKEMALLLDPTSDAAVATLAVAETHCATVVITYLPFNDSHLSA